MTTRPRPKLPHISTCICTFRRPALLCGLLRTVQRLETGGLFTYSVIVVDNDETRSAESVVETVREDRGVRIDYCVEPERNIALARNKAVLRSDGDYVAFVDDDEVPETDWLVRLYQASEKYGADAVLGPVEPRYSATPPAWLLQCGFFDRPRYPTGTSLRWHETRTGNVLLTRRAFDGGQTLFRAEFRHSEDQDFFQRMLAPGRIAVWCDEAVVHEIEGPDRFRLKYFVRRSLLRGNVAYRLAPNKRRTVLKSIIAVLLYAPSVAALALVRRDLAILYLTKSCDHLGKLLAACRIDMQARIP